MVSGTIRREGVRYPTPAQMRGVCEALKGVRVGVVTDLDSRYRAFMRVVHPASVLELLDNQQHDQQLIQQLTGALEGARAAAQIRSDLNPEPKTTWQADIGVMDRTGRHRPHRCTRTPGHQRQVNLTDTP